MTIIRTSMQEQVTTMRMNVVGDKSPTFLVRIVFVSWGMLVNIPVTVPTQLRICESSMVFPKRLAMSHRHCKPWLLSSLQRDFQNF